MPFEKVESITPNTNNYSVVLPDVRVGVTDNDFIFQVSSCL